MGKTFYYYHGLQNPTRGLSQAYPSREAAQATIEKLDVPHINGNATKYERPDYEIVDDKDVTDEDLWGITYDS